MGIILSNASLVNEGRIFQAHLVIEGERIANFLRPDEEISSYYDTYQKIDLSGKVILPGIIDDQVHFREPGLIHKGEIFTESRAAVAGGITSYMEMPNTHPQTTNSFLLEEKMARAEEVSMANYSFYLGATNENVRDLERADHSSFCGIKVFMGSSTGNMLVDDPETLKAIFSITDLPIAVHAEEESIIRQNTEWFRLRHGEELPIRLHPKIRSEEACYESSYKAVEMASKLGTRLHVLHISTAKETMLFETGPVEEKKITAEVCVHHLFFAEKDYDQFGTRIKWNPAVKTEEDRLGLMQALLKGKLDVVATDHAPHSWAEKQQTYFNAPSGGPLVQHSLPVMLKFFKDGIIRLEDIVEKMAHNPARLFQIKERGFLRKGYYADLAIIDLEKSVEISRDNILYKCAWAPFEGFTFPASVYQTYVNGKRVFDNGYFPQEISSKRLEFDR